MTERLQMRPCGCMLSRHLDISVQQRCLVKWHKRPRQNTRLHPSSAYSATPQASSTNSMSSAKIEVHQAMALRALSIRYHIGVPRSSLCIYKPSIKMPSRKMSWSALSSWYCMRRCPPASSLKRTTCHAKAGSGCQQDQRCVSHDAWLPGHIMGRGSIVLLAAVALGPVAL